MFTLFIITVAACEAGIALALFLMLYRRKRSLDVSLWQELREPGLRRRPTRSRCRRRRRRSRPHLTPAGVEPARARGDAAMSDPGRYLLG